MRLASSVCIFCREQFWVTEKHHCFSLCPQCKAEKDAIESVIKLRTYEFRWLIVGESQQGWRESYKFSTTLCGKTTVIGDNANNNTVKVLLEEIGEYGEPTILLGACFDCLRKFRIVPIIGTDIVEFRTDASRLIRKSIHNTERVRILYSDFE